MSTGLDLAVLSWLDGTRSDAMTALMQVVSWVGSWPFVALWALLLAALLDRVGRSRWTVTATMAFALVAQLVIVQGIKWVVARPRPSHVDALTTTLDASFPSGHVAVTATIGVVLVLAVRVVRPAWTWPATVAALVAVALMAMSRMYLGVHYPTDVAAGALVGAAVGLGAHLLVRRATPARSGG